jgi:hypothetical protein
LSSSGDKRDKLYHLIILLVKAPPSKPSLDDEPRDDADVASLHLGDSAYMRSA